MDKLKKVIILDQQTTDRLSTSKDKAAINAQNKMSNILYDNNLPDDMKAKLYTSAQTRFLKINAPETFKQMPTDSALPFQVPDDVMDSLPVTLHSKARRLISHLKSNKRITFNDRNELVVDGQAVSNSNATDLFNAVLRKKPAHYKVGYDDFEKVLVESNVADDILQKPIPSASFDSLKTISPAKPSPASSFESLKTSSPAEPPTASAPKRSGKKKIKWDPWSSYK
jgi:hypothetical protein